MLTFPQIDPVALSLGPLKIHWYGVMYLLAFVTWWLLASNRAKVSKFWNKDKLSDILFYCVLGVMLGGRIGYVVFYHPDYLISDPLEIFAIWHGGMSFHGGLIGVMLAVWLFARKHHQHFTDILEFIAPCVPIGLGLGRIGNFIGGELYGRVTDVPWGMVFPHAGVLPRHPSQLYQAFLEGIVFFAIMWWFSAKERPRGAVAGLFLITYALTRMLVEFVRQPDAHLGFLAFGWLTMGQLLSGCMLLVGAVWITYAYRYNKS